MVAALALISSTSREAAIDVRRLVGYLREAGPDDDTAPQPSLDAVPALVERMRSAGLDVDSRIEGVPVSASGGLQLAAYRVIQEGLTNAARHAPEAHSDVVLGWLPGVLEVSVTSDPATPPPGDDPPGRGHGLVGLRERVAMYDGTLLATATPAGGFVLRAAFPLSACCGCWSSMTRPSSGRA